MGTPRRIAPFALLAVIPLAAALGAQLGTTLVAYVLIGMVIAFLWLVATDKVPERWHAPCLYALTLGLMWQATMLGVHIIGSDTAGEFYVSNRVMAEGAWRIAGNYGTQSSTSVVVGWLAPTLAQVFRFDLVWVYKAILPAVFAVVPVILYWAFRLQFGAKVAVYSAIFLLAVPVATLEIAQIGKAMVAEVFLAVAVYGIGARMDWLRRTLLLTGASILALWSHYTVGLALFAYLMGIGALGVLASVAETIHHVIRKVPLALGPKLNIVLVPCLLATLLSGIAGYYYFRSASEGIVLEVVSRVIPTYSAIGSRSVRDIYVDSPIGGGVDVVPGMGAADGFVGTGSYVAKLRAQEGTVKTALGMDFFDVGGPGKVFRVIQYITQALVLIGAGVVVFRRRASLGFIYGIVGSMGLLFLVAFLPQFSLIINATRFYHMALFFLAPMLLMGLNVFTKNRLAPAILLSAYFVFTSGLVFEVSGHSDLTRLDTPYSVGLSAERTGIVAAYQPGDVDSARWLAYESDQGVMIVGDYNGWHLVSSYIGLGRMRAEAVAYNPTLETLPDKPAYIFLTDWNTRTGKYVESIRGVRGGAGTRETRPLPPMPYQEVYRSGGSVVYYKP
ncbi:hypothetical protein LCGC14_1347630 [marine sediment metagenome]|uniref:Glycosyltransferase RgtA/B/C/D-like domain-containing protein n=1 Tax=marine sediment metagenome TaxID=412755 RepID=A0A0F9KCF2_9ZZZZ